MSAVRPTEYSFDASSASNRSGPNVALNRGSFVECSIALLSVDELGIFVGRYGSGRIEARLCQNSRVMIDLVEEA